MSCFLFSYMMGTVKMPTWLEHSVVPPYLPPLSLLETSLQFNLSVTYLEEGFNATYTIMDSE